MHYPGTEQRLPRHQILRNIRLKKTRRQSRKDYSSDESTASVSSYYSDSSRTLSAESPEVKRKNRKHESRSRSLSPSPFKSPTVRRKRRAGSKVSSPDRHSRKIHRKRRSESDRHRSTSRSSSATPSEKSKSKRRRRKYSGRSQTSSDESSRSRSWSPFLRRKEAVHSGSGSPVSPQRHRKRHCDSTGHSRRRTTSSSGYSKQRLKKHSHMK